MEKCLFCRIVSGEIPAKIEYRDELVTAFADINPLAPVHLLIIPNRHIASMNDTDEKDESLLGRMLLTARRLAAEKKIASGGYKLLIRTGADGGQEVPHIHLHLIGGAPLREEIKPRE